MRAALAPPLEAQRLDLTRLDRWPDFTRPLPVDKRFKDPRLPGQTLSLGAMNPLCPTVPAAFGLKARAHFGVLDYHRGDYTLAAYARSPWTLLKSEWRQFALRSQIHASDVTVTRNMTDEGGIARTYQLFGGAVSLLFNTASTLAFSKVKYGSSSIAESGAHNNLQGTIYGPVNAALAFDDTNFRNNASGSRVHTEAGDNIREIGIFQTYRDTGTADRITMVDRTVIALVAIATNQTASVSYQFQY